MPDTTTPGYEDVFLAVLAMDAYLRDSNDLKLGLSKLASVSQLGNATLGTNSLTSFGINDQATGFLAQSYVDGSGEGGRTNVGAETCVVEDNLL
jgi:hypothetical protein